MAFSGLLQIRWASAREFCLQARREGTTAVKEHVPGSTLFGIFLFAVVMLPLAPCVRAEQAVGLSVEQIAEALGRPILDKDTTLVETQRFCEPRIATLPQFSTRDEWQQYSNRLRQRVLEEIVFRGVPAEWRHHTVKVEWLDWMPDGPGYRMRKLRYEALPGFWVPAILYLPEKVVGKLPAVLHVNGHVGVGKQYPPKQIRCINLAKKGVIGLNIEWVGMGQFATPGFDHARMQQLDLCGVSGLAVFFYNMQRGLDVLFEMEEVDTSRVGVTGLSGGGWQTIVLSSLDTRVALANPVAGYSSFKTRLYHFKDLGDSEQTPSDLAALADYKHLTAFLVPRPLLLTYNSKDDCCFESGYALPPLVEAAQPIYELFGHPEALRTHVNHDPGTHNYERENREAFYQFVKDFFLADDPAFDPKEIPADDQVKSSEELHVPLPESNEDFHTLAMKFSADLPTLPENADFQNSTWRAQYRESIRGCVRFRDHTCRGECVEEKDLENGTVRFWKLSLDGDWTVPAVEWTPRSQDASGSQSPVLLIADNGRKSSAEIVAGYLAVGRRVLVVDPFYFGETTFPSHNWLFAILVAGVGERPLGVQVSQVAAISRWWADVAGDKTQLTALGPRTSVIALLAAALNPGPVNHLELVRPLKSLKDIIANNWRVTDYPELFCFGLLAVTDIPYLVDLCQQEQIEVMLKD